MEQNQKSTLPEKSSTKENQQKNSSPDQEPKIGEKESSGPSKNDQTPSSPSKNHNIENVNSEMKVEDNKNSKTNPNLNTESEQNKKIIEEVQEPSKMPLPLLNGQNGLSQERIQILKNIYQKALNKEVHIQQKNGEWIVNVEGKDFQLTVLHQYVSNMYKSENVTSFAGNID
jgi:hypothetical protein